MLAKYASRVAFSFVLEHSRKAELQRIGETSAQNAKDR